MKRALISVVVVVICCTLIGCARNKLILFSSDFSVNLAKPSANWPKAKLLSPAEQGLLKEYGRPDFFRLCWSEDCELKSYMDVPLNLLVKRGYKVISWIYINRGIEVILNGQSNYSVKPLSDKLKVLCQYGDPESRKVEMDKDLNCSVEVWQYYSAGKLFKFSGDKIISEQTFPRMGRKIKT